MIELTHTAHDLQSEISHTYYHPETDADLIRAEMDVKDMRHPDFVVACSEAMEEATQISRQEGILAAGPYFNRAAGLALSALTTEPRPYVPLPNLYETSPEDIEEIDFDPDSSLLLLYGHAQRKQVLAMEAGFRMPYHKGPDTPRSTLMLTEADRRRRLKAGSKICFDEAWRIVMKGSAPIETKAKSGLVVVGGLVACQEMGKAHSVAEQTDRMVTDMDLKEAGSKALQAFSRADEPELVSVAQQLSDTAVLEITDEIMLAVAA